MPTPHMVRIGPIRYGNPDKRHGGAVGTDAVGPVTNLIPTHCERETTRMKAPIGITMGDAAGVGPEIVARFFTEPLERPALVYGNLAALRRGAAIVGSKLVFVAIASPADALQIAAGTVPVIPVGDLPRRSSCRPRLGRGGRRRLCGRDPRHRRRDRGFDLRHRDGAHQQGCLAGRGDRLSGPYRNPRGPHRNRRFRHDAGQQRVCACCWCRFISRWRKPFER